MMHRIEALIEQLPPDMVQQVEDFVEFLLEKRIAKPRRKPNFGWAGALQDLREQYSSVDLQHQILTWRTEDESAPGY